MLAINHNQDGVKEEDILIRIQTNDGNNINPEKIGYELYNILTQT